MMSNEVPNLPRDLMFDILSRLPIKPLLQFRCVSKPFLSLISNPQFINLHLTRSTNAAGEDGGEGGGHHLLLYYESSDYTKHCYSLRCTTTFAETQKLEFPFNSVHGFIRIVGSSRGVICLFDTNYFTYIGAVILWNPIIRKFKIVPDLHQTHRFRDTFSHVVVCFGFVSRIDDYKVIQILYDSNSHCTPDVLVYELGTNCWRKIGAIAPCYIPNRWSSNVCVNGVVHWKAYKKPKEDGVYNSIMCFDMVNEVFSEMGLPENHSLLFDEMHLAVLASGNSLSLSLHFQNALGDRWEIWSMNEYGVVESWTRLFTIEQAQISLPLYFMDNGQVLVVLQNGKLVSYDPENQIIKDLEICGLPSSFRVVTYMSSLVLLDGGNDELW